MLGRSDGPSCVIRLGILGYDVLVSLLCKALEPMIQQLLCTRMLELGHRVTKLIKHLQTLVTHKKHQ